jgi:hypothetical protein
VKSLDEFDGDCEVLVLTEPLPPEFDEKASIRKLICFPGAGVEMQSP